MKNTNLKIRPVYKTVALGALLVLAGCKRNIVHTNVVLFVEKTNCTTSVYIHDIETGAERVYKDYGETQNMYRYLMTGDTVLVKTAKKEEFYDTRKVLTKRRVDFVCNDDSLRMRHGRAINKMLNQQFGKQR